MYFANPTADAAVHELFALRQLGFIDTPEQGYRHIRPGSVWCADNGCFGKRFNEDRWWQFLLDNAGDAATCAFAVAPDVVGDATATLLRSAPWLPKIRALGYPVAFVAQDGQESLPLPWDDFDVLFIGGTTEFKLGAGARELITAGKRRGMHVHMGRVNSLKRYRYAEAVGCDSVDGTFLTFAPTKLLPVLLGWARDLEDRPALFKFDEGADA